MGRVGRMGQGAVTGGQQLPCMRRLAKHGSAMHAVHRRTVRPPQSAGTQVAGWLVGRAGRPAPPRFPRLPAHQPVVLHMRYKGDQPVMSHPIEHILVPGLQRGGAQHSPEYPQQGGHVCGTEAVAPVHACSLQTTLPWELLTVVPTLVPAHPQWQATCCCAPFMLHDTARHANATQNGQAGEAGRVGQGRAGRACRKAHLIVCIQACLPRVDEVRGVLAVPEEQQACTEGARCAAVAVPLSSSVFDPDAFDNVPSHPSSRPPPS